MTSAVDILQELILEGYYYLLLFKEETNQRPKHNDDGHGENRVLLRDADHGTQSHGGRVADDEVTLASDRHPDRVSVFCDARRTENDAGPETDGAEGRHDPVQCHSSRLLHMAVLHGALKSFT